jgi:hypothetical protein
MRRESGGNSSLQYLTKNQDSESDRDVRQVWTEFARPGTIPDQFQAANRSISIFAENPENGIGRRYEW